RTPPRPRRGRPRRCGPSPPRRPGLSPPWPASPGAIGGDRRVHAGAEARITRVDRRERRCPGWAAATLTVDPPGPRTLLDRTGPATADRATTRQLDPGRPIYEARGLLLW